MRIVLIGMPGSGKTIKGEALGEKLGLRFLDTDEIIVEKLKMSIAEVFDKFGEKYFRDAESEVAKNLEFIDKTVISTGGGIIMRPENMEYLCKNSLTVFLHRDPEAILSDIDTDSRPLLRENYRESFLNLYAARLPLYRKYCNIELDSSVEIEESVEKIAEAYLKGACL
ncbi:MAG: shikimate kinase [Clostridiales bacterium]|jgi:shikimate kinase|nr:shikimate kinase [Clostridiales bacterium]